MLRVLETPTRPRPLLARAPLAQHGACAPPMVAGGVTAERAQTLLCAWWVGAIAGLGLCLLKSH